MANAGESLGMQLRSPSAATTLRQRCNNSVGTHEVLKQ
jgi:hypothetical protein